MFELCSEQHGSIQSSDTPDRNNQHDFFEVLRRRSITYVTADVTCAVQVRTKLHRSVNFVAEGITCSELMKTDNYLNL